jgi:uncharacterized membrane protein YozB (DUF420 family)
LIDRLPTLNALLNSVSALLLCAGYLAIRRGRRELHARFMVTALGVSALFLVSYVTYHAFRGSKPYPHHDGTRPFYYAILWSHIVLAVVNVPLVVMTVVRAARKRFDDHRRIARWTFPVWLYVSVTGVAVYLMLYRL